VVDKKRLGEVADDDLRLLEILAPGRSPAMNKVRDQIASFAAGTSPAGVLLVGPVGSGKSTVARMLAFIRYLHFCSSEKRRQIIEMVKFDGPFRIDKKFLNWFEEINLTGLVESLAQSQLFGILPRAATGVSGRSGVFEQAARGHKPKQAERTTEAKVTGGIVLLDEIGDLAENLQPLLLTVMTGSEVFPVGGEGSAEHGYTFNGCVIGATWQNPTEKLRPDLLSRLSHYRIVLPGLEERRDELPDIIAAIQEDINARRLEEIQRLDALAPDPLSRRKLDEARGRTLKLTDKEIKVLAEEDWKDLGDLRGLRQILERRLLYDGPISRVVAEFRLGGKSASDRTGRALVSTMVDRVCTDIECSTLPESFRKTERLVREGFTEAVRTDELLLQKLSQKFGVKESTIKRQLADFMRDRSRKKQ
jgi:DNA-binding NtrC family response regulator